MISTIRELALDIAQEIILHPERLVKGHAAKNSRGYPVTAKSSDATCWCLIGMVTKRIPARGWKSNINADLYPAEIIRDLAGLPSLAIFNDSPSTTPEVVVKFLRQVADRPIAATIRLSTICVDNPPEPA